VLRGYSVFIFRTETWANQEASSRAACFMVVAICCSETSVYFYRTTHWRYNFS
jgi:hypothetical protein